MALINIPDGTGWRTREGDPREPVYFMGQGGRNLPEPVQALRPHWSACPPPYGLTPDPHTGVCYYVLPRTHGPALLLSRELAAEADRATARHRRDKAEVGQLQDRCSQLQTMYWGAVAVAVVMALAAVLAVL